MDTIPHAMQGIRHEMRGSAQPDLTVPQFRVLAKLYNGPCTNKELSEWIGISPPSMCRTVDVLAKRGLIMREQQKEDRREVLLTLTPKGRKKFNTIQDTTKGKIERRLRSLSAADQSLLLQSMILLKEIFQYV